MGCKQKPETLPFFNSASFEPEWLSPSDSKFTRIHRIADFEFVDQDSAIIDNSTFDGKIYVTDFFFTVCPSICPKMTDQMLKLQERYLKNPRVLFLSHTVTPWMDTVQQLKVYANKKGVISGKWHLVTGQQEEIYSIARNSYFAEKEIGMKKGTDDFLHTENFILVDHKRRIRGIYSGTNENDIERLIEDLDILLEDL